MIETRPGLEASKVVIVMDVAGGRGGGAGAGLDRSASVRDNLRGHPVEGVEGHLRQIKSERICVVVRGGVPYWLLAERAPSYSASRTAP